MAFKMRTWLGASFIFASALLWSVGSFAQAVPAVTNNRSVVITTGNTFQAVLAAGNHRSLTIQNNNATDTCWISFGSIAGTAITAGNAAKASSIELLAGQAYTRYFPYVPSDAIIATCASSSDTLYVDTN
jgi:hypothetical protein